MQLSATSIARRDCAQIEVCHSESQCSSGILYSVSCTRHLEFGVLCSFLNSGRVSFAWWRARRSALYPESASRISGQSLDTAHGG